MASMMRLTTGGSALPDACRASPQQQQQARRGAPMQPSTSSPSLPPQAAAAARSSPNPSSSRWQAPLPSTAARRLPAWTTRKHPSSPLLVGGEEATQQLQKNPLPTPPAADSSGAEPLFPGTSRKRGPPTLLQRLAAAVFYLVPYIDVVEMGNTILKTFPQMQGLHNIPRPFAAYYYSSQFAPLVVFFLIYLCVVRNKKFHHFVRFHAMQATMLDIVGMIFQILRGYFPESILMSPLLDFYDTFAYTLCIFPVLYCIYYALTGKYADVPFVSESVYLQVDSQ